VAVSEKRFAVAASEASRSRAISSRNGARIIPDPVTRNVVAQAAIVANRGRRAASSVMAPASHGPVTPPKRFPRDAGARNPPGGIAIAPADD
jgi:hypothetical protein